MNWIYSTHLAHAATLEATACKLSLLVLSRSGGAPYDESAPRFPVHLGTNAEISQLLGVSTRTIQRHKDATAAALAKTADGRHVPALGFWPDPYVIGPRDAAGRPLYVRITEASIDALVGLAKRAAARTADAALVLALRLLPRLRAGAHAGRRWVVWTTEQIESQLGMGRRTIARAFRLLQAAGLLSWRLCARGYRTISTTSGLLAELPGRYEPRERHNETGGGDTTKPTYYVVEQEENTEQAPRARAVDKPPAVACLEISFIFSDRLPGCTDKAAQELAQKVSTPAEAMAWLRQEGRVLEEARNPAGWFIAAARAGYTSPGFPSGSALKLEASGFVPELAPPTADERAELRRIRKEEDKRQADREEAERIKWEQRAEERRSELAHLAALAVEADGLGELEHLDNEARALAREAGRGRCIYEEAGALVRYLAPHLAEAREAKRLEDRRRSSKAKDEALAKFPHLFRRLIKRTK